MVSTTVCGDFGPALSRKNLREFFARSEQISLHRAGRQRHDFRNFFDRELFAIAQDDRFAVFGTDAGKRDV